MDSIGDFFTKYNHYLAQILSVAFIMLITIAVAQHGWWWLGDDLYAAITGIELPSKTGTKALAKPTAGQRPPVSQVSIAELNLFGIVTQTAEQEVLDAPETKLNLELRGVFSATPTQDSTAIVAEARKPGQLYHIGDRLPGNAILSAVLEDHILIKRGARFETLRFSEFKSGSGGITNKTNSSASQASRTPPRVSARERLSRRNRERSSASVSSPNSRQNRQNRNNKRSSIRDFLRTNRAKIDQDPESLLNEIGVEAVVSGQAMGYRVGSNLPKEALVQAGLKEGDIVISVNGKSVGDVMQDRSLVDKAIRSGKVRAEIQRDDRRFFITVPIR